MEKKIDEPNLMHVTLIAMDKESQAVFKHHMAINAPCAAAPRNTSFPRIKPRQHEYHTAVGRVAQSPHIDKSKCEKNKRAKLHNASELCAIVLLPRRGEPLRSRPIGHAGAPHNLHYAK